MTNITKLLYGDCKFPTFLNSRIRQHYVTILKDRLTVQYTGKSRYCDPGSVQSDVCVPTDCELYYFEIEILDCDTIPKVVVGFTNRNYHLNRNPGAESNSIGYKSEDGLKLFSSGKSESLGPTYGKGDIIGCGISYLKQTYFFTKNGKFIGNAGAINHTEHYPTVGLNTYGEMVKFNFLGPFKYDIEQLLRRTLASERQEIGRSLVSSEMLNNIVHLYLLHGGYADTLRDFIKESRSNPFKRTRSPEEIATDDADEGKSTLSADSAEGIRVRSFSDDIELENEDDPNNNMVASDKESIRVDNTRTKPKKDLKFLDNVYISDFAIRQMEDSLQNRNDIIKLIVKGDIKEAMDLLDSTYPLFNKSSTGYIMLITQYFIEILRNFGCSDEVPVEAMEWMRSHFIPYLQDKTLSEESRQILRRACGLLAYKDYENCALSSSFCYRRRNQTASMINEEILTLYNANQCALKTLVKYLTFARKTLRERNGNTGPIYASELLCRPFVRFDDTVEDAD